MRGLRICLLVLLLLGLAASGVAQEAPPLPEYRQAVVTAVMPLGESREGERQGVKTELVQVRLQEGANSGQEIKILNHRSGMPGYDVQAVPGDKVMVAITREGGKVNYHLADFYRLDKLGWLLGAFVLTLLLVGGKVGVKSILVIGVSLYLIFQFFIHQVLGHQWNIIVLTFLVSSAITVLTQVTISGWNHKSWGAIVGTVGGVAIAGLLAHGVIGGMHLTGLESEEAIMLKATILKNVDFQGILFAGIVLGSLGAVMDVAISLASAIYEIHAAHPAISLRELIRSGLNVGRDVMGTMANTLILAYAGSSLPLILLITAQRNKALDLTSVLNSNVIVTEISRALVGSIGLVACIPVTVLATALWVKRAAKLEEAGADGE